MKIEILGTGCAKCKTLEKITRETVAEIGIDADIQKVEDILKIMQFNILFLCFQCESITLSYISISLSGI